MKYLFPFLFFIISSNLYSQPQPDNILQDIMQHGMVKIKGATFQMGNPNGKKNAKPVHPVKLNDYQIAKYEVPQRLWYNVMGGDTTGKSYCAECAVFDKSWDSIQQFLAKLNQWADNKGYHFRLPTEAEWEYAASGADLSKGYKYCGSNNPDEVAWYAPNSGMVTHPVGLKKPNELGLYDMSGNVWELCSDWYHTGYYKQQVTDNPNNQKKAVFRVVRGGSWRSEEERCQVRARNRQVHDHNISNCGFRLVLG